MVNDDTMAMAQATYSFWMVNVGMREQHKTATWIHWLKHLAQQKKHRALTTQNRAMPEYELFYFPITGLGEPLRLTFLVAGVPFKDTTPANDTSFNDRKTAAHPYSPEAGGLPVLTIDGKAYAQSRAILRYLGRIFSYEGGLWGDVFFCPLRCWGVVVIFRFGSTLCY